MLGILVELALSWIIVWIAEKKNLSVLRLTPAASRLKGFAFFFFIATVAACWRPSSESFWRERKH